MSARPGIRRIRVAGIVAAALSLWAHATPCFAQPAIQALGTDDQRVFVVFHGDSWSLHAESVIASTLLNAWHEAGGPSVQAKVVLDYPYTLSLHRVSAERVLEGILEGWSYTLHYDATGRLDHVRVYSAEPQRMFKTPRLVESLAAWKILEVPPGTDPNAAEVRRPAADAAAPAAAPADDAVPPAANAAPVDEPAPE